MSKVKVKFRVSSVGIQPGDVVDVDKERADYLIENGHAVAVKDATPPKSDKG